MEAGGKRLINVCYLTIPTMLYDFMYCMNFRGNQRNTKTKVALLNRSFGKLPYEKRDAIFS